MKGKNCSPANGIGLLSTQGFEVKREMAANINVADVLGHIFSGKETDPYDIHEILWFFRQLDAEYRLL